MPAQTERSTRRGRAGALLGVLLAVALAEGTASGEPPGRLEAAARFDRGIHFYDAGNFAAALAEFEAAQRAVPGWQLWLNIGLAHRQLFRYGEAVADFHRYLDEGGERIPRDKRALVDKELRDIAGLVAEVAVHVEGGPATVEVDGAGVGGALFGAGRPLLLAPGPHVITASRDGAEPDRREVNVLSGQHLEITLAPRPRPTTAALSVTSHPEGADLTIDDSPVGRTPWSGELGVGGHEVRASLAGHATTRAEVVLTAGQRRTVTLELLAVAAPPPR